MARVASLVLMGIRRILTKPAVKEKGREGKRMKNKGLSDEELKSWAEVIGL